MFTAGTNLGAMDASRNLAQLQLGIAKNFSKLSSGLRITSAADDPAGLMISEQMRSQIGSLEQQIQNTDISINKYQTAGSAVTQLQDSLIQLRSLAVGALNEGYNDASSFAAYNTAAQNLVNSYNRGIDQAQFGLQPLLDGSENSIASLNPLGDIDLSSPEAAEEALQRIDEELDTLGEVQGEIGAKVANDLEATRDTLSVTLQNLTAAESAIRDVDFAQETAQLVRNQMLQEASVAMLAQAHQAAKGVLGIINP